MILFVIEKNAGGEKTKLIILWNINKFKYAETKYTIAKNINLNKFMKILLWLDDVRNPFENNWLNYSPIKEPFECIWVKSYFEFTEWIKKNGLPDGICFDHDLGMDVAIKARNGGISKKKSRQLKQQEKTGYDCAKWLVGYCIDNQIRLPKYNIQSANPVGKANIDGLFKSFIKHNEYEK